MVRNLPQVEVKPKLHGSPWHHCCSLDFLREVPMSTCLCQPTKRAGDMGVHRYQTLARSISVVSDDEM
jgi:hypothetical protein